MVQFDLEGREAPPMPEREFSWPVYDIFETGDGKQIFIGAVTEGQWEILCDILGLHVLKADPRLQRRMDQIEAREWTIPLVARAVSGAQSKALIEELEKSGIPFSSINRPAEMYLDPHVNREGGLLKSALPEGGNYRAPGLPFEVDGQSVGGFTIDLPAIGQDTKEILSSLGISKEAIHTASGQNREHFA